MLNFLHTYIPSRILIELGPITIYWYGVFIILGILAAIVVALNLASRHNISKDAIIDLAFWLIIGGILGARIYHIFLELPYYLDNPSNIFKIWQGGLAIHGGIITGAIILWFYAKTKKINFWILSSIVVTSLALGQAIGRWGNYFNQEIFGTPTNLPWGIPIETANRMSAYYNFNYFHPTFLYESLGNLFVFACLLLFNIYLINNKKFKNFDLPIVLYLILYSVLRFTIEFIRIDQTPVIMDLRLPQLVSVILVIGAIIYLKIRYKNSHNLALVFSKIS